MQWFHLDSGDVEVELVDSKRVPCRAIAGIQVTGFTTSIGSPSANVDPNPYPGLLDFAMVGTKIVILSMLFADIPVDTATFDSIEAKADQRGAAGLIRFDTVPYRCRI